MTLLLASIGGVDEAERAVARGADIVDLRGEATPESLRETLSIAAGRRAVMAGAGSLAALETLADAGADYLKILTRDDADAIAAAAPLARRTRLIGIMLAEDGIDPGAIRLMGETGFAGLILNTGDKRNLLDVLDITALADVADAARGHDLMVGFAGALEPPDIPRLLLLQPDVLAVRFDASIDAVRAQIPPDQRRRARAGAKIDYRLARAGEPQARAETTLDRIFVRDFVLPLEIGTYARERGSQQTVRFSVDVGIARPSDVPQDMHEVLSYDVITDSIRMIAARGHVALAETLAEKVAAAVLAHPRAIRVTVRVEKLDTGPGSVGVEITRERPAEAATVHPLFKAGDGDAGT